MIQKKNLGVFFVDIFFDFSFFFKVLLGTVRDVSGTLRHSGTVRSLVTCDARSVPGRSLTRELVSGGVQTSGFEQPENMMQNFGNSKFYFFPKIVLVTIIQ